jgi:hypothetical protein
MMVRGVRAAALTIALVALLGVDTAVAQTPAARLVLEIEAESRVGRQVAVGAYLVDPAGNPVRGELVTFYADVEFMNTLDNMEIGRALTDDTGLAFLAYRLKRSGDQTIVARFSGNEVFDGAEASASLRVAPGPQTYELETPFRIPGVNVYIVGLVLAAVWGIYLGTMALFWLISRAEGPESRGPSITR